jgi:hypothetical protein
MGTGSSFPGVKRPGPEADHSPSAGAKLKKLDLYIQSSIRLHGVVLHLLSTGANFPYYEYISMISAVGTLYLTGKSYFTTVVINDSIFWNM